jgi:tRNA modification GTPase
MHPIDDTIAAIATAPGAAGLAVVRLSGPAAIATADAVFRGAHPLAAAAANTLHHGWAVWPEPDPVGAGGPAETAGPVAAGGTAEAARPVAAGGTDAASRPLGRASCAPSLARSLAPPIPGSREASSRRAASSDPPAPVRPGRRAASDPPALSVAPTPALDGARRLDEVVAAVFRAPHSYTREDVIELSCHGGRMAAERVLAALLRAGARLARPGEFTLRAFLNGRIDLAQAEAVADLIHAETAAAHELALAQLAGELSRRLEAITERVADALAEVEARVDFAEDVGGIEVPPQVVDSIAGADRELESLLAGAAYARAVREGARVPIVGRPNVGKSSLFNALLGEERAIVADAPGTTRDRVSEAIEVAGVRVTLSDTAGLRETREPVEALGVARTREALERCAVALWVVDGAAPIAPEDRWIAEQLRGMRVLVALNKRDLPEVASEADVAELLDGARWRAVAVSAVRGEGLDALRAALAALLGGDRLEGGPGAAASNPRHVEALARAREALARARAVSERGDPGEITAFELRECLAAVGEVTGRNAGEDLLERIFSRFCIGK